jgi:predicted metalloprotease with PDZ domain
MGPVKLTVASLALATALAVSGRAQEPPDTLMYSVAVYSADRHLSVEARLTTAAGSVVLAAPARSGAAGTVVVGFAATDDRGGPVSVQRTGSGYVIDRAPAGAVRFRYRLDFNDSVSSGSTASGLDSLRLYAVTRSLFVAPDPVLSRKTGRPYPVTRVSFVLPEGWRLVANWDSAGPEFRPRSGEDFTDATIAAAADYRLYRGRVGDATYSVAVRGRRGFSDSALAELVGQALTRSAEAFGPVPVPRVTFISDAGRKGRTSGSLQGLSSIGLLWEPGELLERSRSHDVFHETLHLWFGGAMEAERWWTEGVTDYIAARLYAEWRDDPRELAALIYESLANYGRIPHRTSLTMASENRERRGGDNTVRLVYRKGMLAGLLLDAAIRRRTRGRSSLDDVARRLLSMAAGRPSRRVTEEELREEMVRIGGRPVADEWARVVAGTSLVNAAQVAVALRTVTGVELPPPASDKPRPKILSNTPNP